MEVSGPTEEQRRSRALYAAHGSELLGFFARRTLDPQAAVDLTAETFAQGFAGRRRFRGGDDPNAARAWLFGIARHLLAAYLRRGYAERRALRRLGVEPVALSEESHRRVEELAGLETLRSALANELRRLSASQREALTLRVVDELPFSEVARRLGISEQSARARVSRALRALHVRLSPEVSA
jgi:RNA polymerase sigma-70 factor, ECF subfamily